MRSPPPSESSKRRSVVRSACRSRRSTALITTTSYSVKALSVRVPPAEPAAGPVALAAGGGGARPARGGLRWAAWLLGGATILGAVVLIACELAAARVPQHRAALEELIRQQTGLNVSFSELSARWGWYRPEGVFHGVVLGDPGGRGALLRAPQLIVGLDAWGMVRSGQLQAGRITLVTRDIDLGA